MKGFLISYAKQDEVWMFLAVRKAPLGLDGRMASLNGLMGNGDIAANDDVEIGRSGLNLGNLQLFHEKTPVRGRLKKWSGMDLNHRSSPIQVTLFLLSYHSKKPCAGFEPATAKFRAWLLCR